MYFFLMQCPNKKVVLPTLGGEVKLSVAMLFPFSQGKKKTKKRKLSTLELYKSSVETFF